MYYKDSYPVALTLLRFVNSEVVSIIHCARPLAFWAPTQNRLLTDNFNNFFTSFGFAEFASNIVFSLERYLSNFPFYVKNVVTNGKSSYQNYLYQIYAKFLIHSFFLYSVVFVL